MAVRAKGWATTAIWVACMVLFAVLHLGSMLLMVVLIGPLAVAFAIQRLVTGRTPGSGQAPGFSGPVGIAWHRPALRSQAAQRVLRHHPPQPEHHEGDERGQEEEDRVHGRGQRAPTTPLASVTAVTPPA